MAAVSLNFVPPDVPDLVALVILESDAQAGVYSIVEEVTEVGDYPNYITRYTTNLATSLSGWFKIKWRDSKGAETPLSQAIQGGTTTTVGEIIDRVLNRSPGADEQTVQQVAEAVVEQYFHVDPYTVDWNDVTYRQREGLTLLTMAFSTIAQSASTGGRTRWVAGLVSYESDNSNDSSMDDLLKLAYKWLGLSQTRVAQMAEIAIIGGLTKAEKDQSRLLVSEFA